MIPVHSGAVFILPSWAKRMAETILPLSETILPLIW